MGKIQGLCDGGERCRRESFLFKHGEALYIVKDSRASKSGLNCAKRNSPAYQSNIRPIGSMVGAPIEKGGEKEIEQALGSTACRRTAIRLRRNLGINLTMKERLPSSLRLTS